MSDEDRLYILWGWSQRWSNRKIAGGVPCSIPTVHRYKRLVMSDPGVVFQLPLLLQVGPRKYRCQFCTETRPTRERAMRHVLSHIMSVGYAKTAPLDNVEKL